MTLTLTLTSLNSITHVFPNVFESVGIETGFVAANGHYLVAGSPAALWSVALSHGLSQCTVP